MFSSDALGVSETRTIKGLSANEKRQRVHEVENARGHGDGVSPSKKKVKSIEVRQINTALVCMDDDVINTMNGTICVNVSSASSAD